MRKSFVLLCRGKLKESDYYQVFATCSCCGYQIKSEAKNRGFAIYLALEKLDHHVCKESEIDGQGGAGTAPNGSKG